MTSIWQHVHDACPACYKEAQEITRLRESVERHIRGNAKLCDVAAKNLGRAEQAEALAARYKAAVDQAGIKLNQALTSPGYAGGFSHEDIVNLREASQIIMAALAEEEER